ncbi:MAG: vWA domain-containing protein [Myxococcota bacterium]
MNAVRTTPRNLRAFATLLLSASSLAGCTVQSDTPFGPDAYGDGGGGADDTDVEYDGIIAEADEGGEDGTPPLDPSEEICETHRFDVEANPPEVMLLLDKSGSMTSNTWQYQGAQVTRWSTLHAVTEDVVTTYDASIHFGALLFPASDAGSHDFEGMCRMDQTADVEPGAGNATAILDAIPAANEATRGATPTRAAIELATSQLVTSPSEGARAMVLVTDGLANCADPDDPARFDDAVRWSVHAAHNQKVQTYVIGVDIRDEGDGHTEADARHELDLVARAGGVPASDDPTKPAFYDATDAGALYDALDEIAARVECTVTLPGSAAPDATVAVAVDGQAIDEVLDCAQDDGWHFADAEARSQIELCNAACDALRVTGTVETTQCTPGELEPFYPEP